MIDVTQTNRDEIYLTWQNTGTTSDFGLLWMIAEATINERAKPLNWYVQSKMVTGSSIQTSAVPSLVVK